MYKPIKTFSYKGETYTVHDSHINVIELVNLLDNEDDEFERAIIAVTKLFGVDVPVEQPVVDLATEILSNGRKVTGKPSKKDMDFLYDYQTIRMDILRDYQIDIDKVDTNWAELTFMIENLGKDSSLNRKREIRNQKLGDIKDKSTRKAWAEAKKQVELPNMHEHEAKNRVKEQRDSMNELLNKLL